MQILLAPCYGRTFGYITEPFLIGLGGLKILFKQVLTGLCSKVGLRNSFGMVFFLKHEMVRFAKLKDQIIVFNVAVKEL